MMKDAAQREELMRYNVGHITEQGVDAEWVFSLSPIRKATLNFVGKFWSTIMRHRLCHTMADNHLTLDRAAIVACLMARYEIDFIWCIITEIHERALQCTTTVPLPCLIFRLCRDSTVLMIVGIDQLLEVTRN